MELNGNILMKTLFDVTQNLDTCVIFIAECTSLLFDCPPKAPPAECTKNGEFYGKRPSSKLRILLKTTE